MVVHFLKQSSLIKNRSIGIDMTLNLFLQFIAYGIRIFGFCFFGLCCFLPQIPVLQALCVPSFPQVGNPACFNETL